MREKKRERRGEERLLVATSLLDGLPEFPHHRRRHVGFLSDHRVVLVVGVVCITQTPIRPELELQKLVAKLPLVSHVVPHVEFVVVVGHWDDGGNFEKGPSSARAPLFSQSHG